MFDVTKMIGEVQEYVAAAVRPLADRLKALETREPPTPVKGDKGDKGDPGDNAAVDDEQIHAAFARAFNPWLQRLTAVESREIPTAIKGDKGDPGDNAVVSYEDIVRAVEEVHERLIAKYMLDLERRGMDSIQRALDKITPPKDGRDGLGADGFDQTYDPDTHEIVQRWTTAGVAKTLRYPAGGIRPGGYWRPGTKALAGSAWVDDGCMWIALKDTTARPGIKREDWIIGARKGRDANGSGAVELNGH